MRLQKDHTMQVGVDGTRWSVTNVFESVNYCTERETRDGSLDEKHWTGCGHIGGDWPLARAVNGPGSNLGRHGSASGSRPLVDGVAACKQQVLQARPAARAPCCKHALLTGRSDTKCRLCIECGMPCTLADWIRLCIECGIPCSLVDRVLYVRTAVKAGVSGLVNRLFSSPSLGLREG